MQKKHKIVILISGRGSNMKAIIDACDRGAINAEVVLVLSNRQDAAGLLYAAEKNIPTQVISHKNFEDRALFDTALAEAIHPFGPDLICLAGFMRILGADFVRRFAGKILNIHPSLLPKYKGLNTHQRAIDARDEEAGCSVHIVTKGLDDGPVLEQTKVPIKKGDNSETLANRVLSVEHQTYVAAIRNFINGL